MSVDTNSGLAACRCVSFSGTPRLTRDATDFIASFGESVTHVTVERVLLEPGAFKAIASLPNLRQLEIVDSNFDDQQLREVSRMTSLRYLTLRRTLITDDAIAILAKMRFLSGLALQENLFLPERRAREDLSRLLNSTKTQVIGRTHSDFQKDSSADEQ